MTVLSFQGRARQLYRAGYKSVKAVAHADPETLVSGIEHMPRKTAKQIVASAKVTVIQLISFNLFHFCQINFYEQCLCNSLVY